VGCELNLMLTLPLNTSAARRCGVLLESRRRRPVRHLAVPIFDRKVLVHSAFRGIIVRYYGYRHGFQADPKCMGCVGRERRLAAFVLAYIPWGVAAELPWSRGRKMVSTIKRWRCPTFGRRGSITTIYRNCSPRLQRPGALLRLRQSDPHAYLAQAARRPRRRRWILAKALPEHPGDIQRASEEYERNQPPYAARAQSSASPGGDLLIPATPKKRSTSHDHRLRS
jgi:hypothetical protein